MTRPVETDAPSETLTASARGEAPSPPAARAHEELPVIPITAYAFGREVARGGMGRVVAARDLRIGRPVAVKELLDSAPVTAARFEREARITARLQHPGIVPIYEIGAWPDGTPFYSMRLVEGRTLSVALAEADNRLALLPAVIAAAEAVAFAHAHGVIHRDLKPSNIMVGAFGETVVIDWGLAKALDDPDDPAVPDAGPYREAARSEMTAVGQVIGTAAYMPPEQARGEPVDRRADVYALGAILYHLLAGTAPYRGSSALDIVARVRAASPEPLPAGAPRDLASIVAKAMARAPGDRYADASALAAELQRFQTGRLVEAHAYSRAERLRRWLRRRRATVIAAAAALVALAVAGAIGLAGVLRERDIATAHEEREHAVAVSLLEEQGRQELLAGNVTRALAYLDAAMQQGLDTPELRFMLARALPSLEGRRGTFGCGDAVTSIAADDQLLVAACGERVRAWELPSQRPRFTASIAHAALVDVVGGTILAIGDEAVVLAPDGVVSFHLGDHAARGAVVAGGRRVVVFYADGTARIWDARTGRALAAIGEPRTDRVLGAASRDGSVIALGASGAVTLFDGATGARRGEFTQGSELTDVSLSDDGATVVACGVDGDATVWRAGTTRAIGGHRNAIRRCPVAPDGSRTILTSLEMRNDIWDLRTDRIVGMVPGYTDETEFSPDSSKIAGGYRGITLYDAATAAPVARYERRTTREARFGGGLVFTVEDTAITAWTTQTAQQFSFMPPPGALVLDANVDATRAITQAADGTLALWDPRTGGRIPHAEIRHASFRDLDLPFPRLFSGDGTRLAAWDGRDAVLVLDARTGATLASFPAGREPSTQLDAHGERVLIAGDGPPRIWSVARGVLLGALPGTHADGLSADGTRVLAWTDPATVSVWDVDAGRAVASLAAVGELHVAGYDRSGTRIVACEICAHAHNGNYVLFDVHSGQRLAEVGASAAAAFSADGEHVGLATRDSFTVWDLRDGSAQSVPRAPPIAPILVDARGELGDMSGLDDARIVSARDGRELWHFDRYQPTTTTTDSTSSMLERWTPSGDLLVLEGHLAAWRFESETRDAAAIHRVIDHAIPWREHDGKLVAIRGTMRGHVRRAGAPAADVTVTATDVDPRVYVRHEPYPTRTRADGSYEITGLPMGMYDVSTAGGAVSTVDVKADAETTVDLVTR